ncbi:MAG: hypothetical protein K6T80_03460 [Firmicutes bacterium]|nr:hypothetical protein [Bacillota bacterium]
MICDLMAARAFLRIISADTSGWSFAAYFDGHLKRERDEDTKELFNGKNYRKNSPESRFNSTGGGYYKAGHFESGRHWSGGASRTRARPARASPASSRRKWRRFWDGDIHHCIFFSRRYNERWQSGKITFVQEVLTGESE